MNRRLVEAHGRDAARDPTLVSIARSNSAVAALAAWLAEGPDIKHLEQEALDPISPLEQLKPHGGRPGGQETAR
jgi:hypothetical protein